MLNRLSISLASIILCGRESMGRHRLCIGSHLTHQPVKKNLSRFSVLVHSERFLGAGQVFNHTFVLFSFQPVHHANGYSR